MYSVARIVRLNPNLARKCLYSSSASSHHHILTSRKGKVGLVQLNRPRALNALSTPLMMELNEALRAFDADAEIGCMVLTGSEKAFAGMANI